MSNSNNILKNAISAILLVLITAVVYIFLYKYLVAKVGIDELGVWSLVIATISVGAVANTALSESVVRFVALYSVKNDWDSVAKVLITACYTLGILLSVFLLIIYGASYYLLPFVVKNHFLFLARSILPYGLIGFWLNGVASAFLSFFEGMRLAYIKNIIIACSVLLFYIGSKIMVPQYGLIGVVYAQVLQSGVLLVVSAILVFIKAPVFTFRPLGIRSDLFKQIVNFSVNLQVLSVVTILYEPVTKYFLAKYGNIGFVGFYEMANRLVQQARSVIIAGTQIMVPNLTIEAEKSINALKGIYEKVFSAVFSANAFMLSAISIFLPYISIFWIGHLEPVFIISTLILGFGWYVNTSMSPVYFVNFATNSLKINLNGQVIIGLLNPIFCYVMGKFFGSYFIILGWVAALICGSVYTLLTSHKKYGINNFDLFKPEIKKLIWGTFFSCLAWVMYFGLQRTCALPVRIGLAVLIFLAMGTVSIFIDSNLTYLVNLVKLKFKQA